MGEIVLRWLVPIILSGFLGVVLKIVRDLKTQRIAIQSLLRSEMVKVYYKYKKEQKLPYYTKKAWCEDYEAYTKLGGNSFIRDLKKEIEKWEVE